jgi:hypothetical protein
LQQSGGHRFSGSGYREAIHRANEAQHVVAFAKHFLTKEHRRQVRAADHCVLIHAGNDITASRTSESRETQ